MSGELQIHLSYASGSMHRCIRIHNHEVHILYVHSNYLSRYVSHVSTNFYICILKNFICGWDEAYM